MTYTQLFALTIVKINFASIYHISHVKTTSKNFSLILAISDFVQQILKNVLHLPPPPPPPPNFSEYPFPPYIGFSPIF